MFRNVITLGDTNPRFCFAASPSTSSNFLFLGYKDGFVTREQSNIETAFSPAAASGATNAGTATSSAVLSFASTPAGVAAGQLARDNTTNLIIGTVLSNTGTTVTLTANVTSAVTSGDTIGFYAVNAVDATWSGTTLANVIYLNRSDRVPWALRPSDATFVTLSSLGSASPVGWDSTWSCSILRSCAGALVALNVTKGGTNYPTMVKTSSLPTSTTVPSSWDQTNPATLATENILSKMDGMIMDACSLGHDLIIYGQREAWLMHADGSTFVYSYTKLPFNKGALNANCSFEYEGKNYVFGTDDIWVHDGNTERSLVDEKNRDFIYSSLNILQANRCFISFNPKLKEMYFAYVSGDAYTAFQTSTGIVGCNRQATLNLVDNTWTFDDLPSVFASCNTVISNALTYATVTAAYTTMGGTYQDQEDGLKRTPVYVGENSTTYGFGNTLYALDPYGANSNVAYPVDTHATAPRYLERIGLDMHEFNTEVRGYKTLSTIYPQARVDPNGSPLYFAVGASDQITSTSPLYSAYQPYDGNTNYRLDFNVAGRWLSYRISYPDYRSMSITGFDFDLKTTGHF